MPTDKINLDIVPDEVDEYTDEGDSEDEAEEIGVFPDGTGPSEELVDLWKSKFGQVYCTEVEEGEYYVWRILTRPELRQLAKLNEDDSLFKEDLICEKCVLWPTDFNPTIGKAGVPTVLAEQIFEKSGFVTRTGPIAL